MFYRISAYPLSLYQFEGILKSLKSYADDAMTLRPRSTSNHFDSSVLRPDQIFTLFELTFAIPS